MDERVQQRTVAWWMSLFPTDHRRKMSIFCLSLDGLDGVDSVGGWLGVDGSLTARGAHRTQHHHPPHHKRPESFLLFEGE